jgi:hypothetical protein
MLRRPQPTSMSIWNRPPGPDARSITAEGISTRCRLRPDDYDRAVTTASPQSEPDLLTVGLGEAGRLSRRGKFLLIAVALALLAGLLLWRFWPTPAPLFSLSDLQDVYSGMVRHDGTNEASVIDRRWSSEQDGYILPAACEPLFEATVLNRAPREALDGVGTFWDIDRSSVSLFTYRFPDLASTDREYQRLTAVVDNCRDVPVQVHARPASRGMLTITPLILDANAPPQIAYVLTTNDGTKLVVHVLAFNNTISWQFRYEPVAGAYLPLTAQRVMDSLTDQMRAVQDLMVTR